MPIAYPLPRQAVEQFGGHWWLPEHIVSNGPFRLVEYRPDQGLALERNPRYHGEFSGNLKRIEIEHIQSQPELFQCFQDNRADLAGPFAAGFAGDSADGWQRYRLYSTGVIFFNPTIPPFDDLRVRQAFALAIDREQISRATGLPPVQGGVIPPGLPGHSLDIGLASDLEGARRLMAQAGYPGGRGFPLLKMRGVIYSFYESLNLFEQWRSGLGIELVEDEDSEDSPLSQINFRVSIWSADYPDPNNFLRDFVFNAYLHRFGWWQDPAFDHLLETAACTIQRGKRMDLYRQADRYLVSEQVLAVPFYYPQRETIYLIKPWVKHFQVPPLGSLTMKDVIIDARE